MEKKDNYEFDPSNQQKPSRIIRWGSLSMALFWAFLLALILSNVVSPFLSRTLKGLVGGIASILIGILIAFIFYRLVNFIEQVVLKNAFKNNRYKFALKRFISLTIVVVIIVGIIVLVMSILVPKIVSIVVELTDQSGSGWTDLTKRIVDEISDICKRWFGVELEQESIRNTFNSIFTYLSETVAQINDFLALSINVFTGIFEFVIGVLLAVLILKDKEKIAKFSKRFVYTHFKKERADNMCIMTKNTGKVLFDYVICKFIEFAILFVTLGLAYTIMGLKFTWEAALLIGLFNFIPYFGVFIGASFSVLLTLIFNSLDAALYMALASIIITSVEGNTIIPFITGNKLKVSALVVISSIIIGGAMFGMVGMFLAPPIAAIIASVVTSNMELKENRLKYAMEVQALHEQNIKDLTQGDTNKKLEGKQLSLAEDLTIKEEDLPKAGKGKEEKTKRKLSKSVKDLNQEKVRTKNQNLEVGSKDKPTKKESTKKNKKE